ncbi:UNVERIFIED_CONTAM: Retrovirus-related Pol polyprotein from transposon TNT 1-94 [Sesamum latifolium]|uniref:Retrovirus-related Pol polyprotein from transposon TNT 1-94 n=1 Tax=Sesamum latifolium TaxID=2727402 RepID=A0AAW2UHC4_9LAMI
MQNSKRDFLFISHGKYLSKKQSPTTPDELKRMSKIPYVSAIGSIMYSMVYTRPDVSCALSMTSRFQSCPGNDHWTTVNNILKYLKRTKDYFLTYGGDYELCVKGYTDASFQIDKDDYRSQFSYVFILNGDAVSWKSFKQNTVADSTTDLNTLLQLKLQNRLFRSRILFLSLVLFLVLRVRLSFIVTTMELLHKQKNLHLTKSPSM